MKNARALKDFYYRRSLGAEAPEHPAGEVSLRPLADDELAGAAGAGTAKTLTFGCCNQPGTGWTWTTPSFYPTVSIGCVATVTICN